jgi:uncharacterized protein HemX
MNGQTRLLAVLLAVLVIGGGVFYLFDQERRVSQAQARAETAEETARRVSELEADRVWQGLQDAVQAFEIQLEEPKRKEALEQLKREIQRLKSRFRYKQLNVSR